MRKHKSHCNKKRVCTNKQHVAKTPATSTAIERERVSARETEFIFEVQLRKRVLLG